MSQEPLPPAPDFKGLLTLARDLGATDARIIPAAALVVEERFAAMCAEPHRCPSYGLAPGCPPHAIRPTEFQRLLDGFRHALVFKIDASLIDLCGDKRIAIARQIHRIAARVEDAADRHGFGQAFAIAAGSCKDLFCAESKTCLVLSGKRPCPHADTVRPSLSALGVNFALLAQSAGWAFAQPDAPDAAKGETSMAMLAGLVLLA